MPWEFESPPGHQQKPMDKNDLAYITGIAMGDGNLSNPNGKATRLRISCDIKYKNLIDNIIISINNLLPKNKIGIVKRKDNCIDISSYSNKWEILLNWKAKSGSKEKQKISVPSWIKKNTQYSQLCLRGLFETDGSIYTDRKYRMANFVTIIPTLANDVMEMITNLGFKPNMQKFKAKNGKTKHTIRISRNTNDFIELLKIDKS
ncbi:MAG: hypothetical protein ACD_9C00200G0007 [uncultured bacterium]|nr:MAG: hypothetical protein ACD_9C00200G0007 [uncultured bacterium]